MKKNMLSKASEILSSFEHLYPDKTMAAEIALLKNSDFEIVEIAENNFELHFRVSDRTYIAISFFHQQIEESLMKKAMIIFKPFPRVVIQSVKIVRDLSKV